MNAWETVAPPALRDAPPAHRLWYTVGFLASVVGVVVLMILTGAVVLGCNTIPGTSQACKAVEIADDVCEILVRVPDPATGKMTAVRVPAAALRREGQRALSGGTPAGTCP